MEQEPLVFLLLVLANCLFFFSDCQMRKLEKGRCPTLSRIDYFMISVRDVST